jgi:hypothetical protein
MDSASYKKISVAKSLAPIAPAPAFAGQRVRRKTEVPSTSPRYGYDPSLPLALAIGKLFGKPVEEIFGDGCGKKR